MTVNAVSSNNVPATPPAQQAKAKQVIDRPTEKPDAPEAPAAPPAPTVNTSGQTTGTTINTTA